MFHFASIFFVYVGLGFGSIFISSPNAPRGVYLIVLHIESNITAWTYGRTLKQTTKSGITLPNRDTARTHGSRNDEKEKNSEDGFFEIYQIG